MSNEWTPYMNPPILYCFSAIFEIQIFLYNRNNESWQITLVLHIKLDVLITPSFITPCIALFWILIRAMNAWHMERVWLELVRTCSRRVRVRVCLNRSVFGWSLLLDRGIAGRLRALTLVVVLRWRKDHGMLCPGWCTPSGVWLSGWMLCYC